MRNPFRKKNKEELLDAATNAIVRHRAGIKNVSKEGLESLHEKGGKFDVVARYMEGKLTDEEFAAELDKYQPGDSKP